MASSSPPPSSHLPPSMGPGAQVLQQGERPGGLLQEISEIRSHYNVHLASDAVELAYELHGQPRHYRIPFDNMPIGSWTRALCYGGATSAKVNGTLLIDMIRATENISGRRITQEEAEGIGFYSSRRMMTMYVGQLSAIGIGVASAWVGRKDMKFPFMKPKSPEKYDSFPLRALPLLKGSYARAMWQITRGNVYIAMWLFFTNPLFRSMADTRLTVGLYQDRRTHDLTNAMKGGVDRLRSNRASEAATGAQSQSQSAEPTQSQDDASPAGGFYDSQSSSGQDSYAGDSSFTDGNTDTGLITDSAIQQRQTKQTSPNAWSKAQDRASKSSHEQDKSSVSSDFFFDDASPTAGNDPDMAAPQPHAKRAAPGAWGRLRRGENSQTTRSESTQASRSYSSPSRDFETRGDSFSFSDSEKEKSFAKQQAQKEFDTMLERERAEGGSTDYARDMRATQAGEESNSGTENAWSRRRRG